MFISSAFIASIALITQVYCVANGGETQEANRDQTEENPLDPSNKDFVEEVKKSMENWPVGVTSKFVSVIPQRLHADAMDWNSPGKNQLIQSRSTRILPAVDPTLNQIDFSTPFNDINDINGKSFSNEVIDSDPNTNTPIEVEVPSGSQNSASDGSQVSTLGKRNYFFNSEPEPSSSLSEVQANNKGPVIVKPTEAVNSNGDSGDSGDNDEDDDSSDDSSHHSSSSPFQSSNGFFNSPSAGPAKNPFTSPSSGAMNFQIPSTGPSKNPATSPLSGALKVPIASSGSSSPPTGGMSSPTSSFGPSKNPFSSPFGGSMSFSSSPNSPSGSGSFSFQGSPNGKLPPFIHELLMKVLSQHGHSPNQPLGLVVVCKIGPCPSQSSSGLSGSSSPFGSMSAPSSSPFGSMSAPSSTPSTSSTPQSAKTFLSGSNQRPLQSMGQSPFGSFMKQSPFGSGSIFGGSMSPPRFASSFSSSPFMRKTWKK